MRKNQLLPFLPHTPPETPMWAELAVGDLITVPGDVANGVFMFSRMNNRQFLTKVDHGTTKIKRVA